MKKRPVHTSELRRRAETFICNKPEELQNMPRAHIQDLLHELRVHHVELEMQNEELRRAYMELEESRNKYYDLFDFAPIGYVTLDTNGLIMEANLTCADMLGIERGRLLKNSFSLFVKKEYWAEFFSWKSKGFETRTNQSCDMELIRNDGRPLCARMEGMAMEEDNGECSRIRVSITDITELKRYAAKLHAAKTDLEGRVEERTAELKRLSHKILNAQEEERKRIARDLHDTLAQNLSAVKYHVEYQMNEMPEKELDCDSHFQTITSMLQDCLEETRLIITNLRPSMLDDLGIVATLHWHCREFGRMNPGIRLATQFDLKEADVPDHLKVVIFRIIQEAFHNINKHSRADSVILALRREGNQLELRIDDDGIGFEPEEALSNARHETGLGFTGMKERAALSGGSFSLTAGRAKGTKIGVSWPLPPPF